MARRKYFQIKLRPDNPEDESMAKATKRIVKAYAGGNDILLMEALQRLVEAGEKALEGKK